ncbi:MAG: hypothetical protein R3B09_18400 [Nannocystaceae bacterium]
MGSRILPQRGHTPEAAGRLDAATTAAHAAASEWLRRIRASDDPETPWLASVADVGVACEVILADRLFRDLSLVERAGLMAWIRASQDRSGAWLSPVTGSPDLSLTSLGWWARVQAGDDPRSEPLVRALRVVHELGGAQRASFTVRLWLAIAGHIPWSWLPAVPAELWLLPPLAVLSPSRVCPWARGLLTPYLLLTRAPARVHLESAAPLLITRDGEAIPPRITSHGLVGDVVQSLDTAMKVLKKLPRGPLHGVALTRAQGWLAEAQQAHGGWFSARPTLLSLLALRVAGASYDDARIKSGLDYLRRARGLARPHGSTGEGEPYLAQGLTGAPIEVSARLVRAAILAGDESAVGWLLGQEITEAGEWQFRTNAAAGGWPSEPGARGILDVEATCAVLDALAALPKSSPRRGPAFAAMRRALEVLVAMQEPDGAFARFERGESEVWMTQAPWRDAELMADTANAGEARARRTARVLRQLARMGWRADDDRVRRGISWLSRHVSQDSHRDSVLTLGELALCAAALVDRQHPLFMAVERTLRSRQREDGSFGAEVATAAAIHGLLALQGGPCVQSQRAARSLVHRVEAGAATLAGATIAGHGFSPTCHDPSAGVREAAVALTAYAAAGGVL